MQYAGLSASADVKNTRLRVYPKAITANGIGKSAAIYRNTANARTQLQQKKISAAAAAAKSPSSLESKFFVFTALYRNKKAFNVVISKPLSCPTTP